MPLYEYGCEQCGNVVEKLQSSPESPAPEACVKCGTTGRMTRMMSATSFQLKGSGWYVTDYAKPKTPSSTTTSTESVSSESSPSSGDGSSSDSGSAGTSAPSTGPDSKD